MKRINLKTLVAAILVFAGTGLLSAQNARIKIDIERTIGEVNPHIYGNFAEHLGRCIYGGIYDEGSPLSDEDGFKKRCNGSRKRVECF